MNQINDKAFLESVENLSALFSRKNTAAKPEKETHAPRPKEERKAPAEARINNTALKNHFSALPQPQRRDFAKLGVRFST